MHRLSTKLPFRPKLIALERLENDSKISQLRSALFFFKFSFLVLLSQAAYSLRLCATVHWATNPQLTITLTVASTVSSWLSVAEGRDARSTTPAPLVGRHKSPRDRAAPYNSRPRYTILSAAVSRLPSAAASAVLSPPSSLLLMLLLLSIFVAASSSWHVTSSSAGSLLWT